MKILAVEFSSPVRSVAVVQAPEPGGGVPVIASCARSVYGDSDRRASDALGLVEEALQKAGLEREDVDCVAVGLGPGSYTGIRSAISLAQGWELARGVKLLGLSSVACLAAQARSEGLGGRVELVVDAQRQEFYLAGYEVSPVCREVEPLRLVPLAELKRREAEGAVIAGPEITRWFPGGRLLLPLASALGLLAADRTDFVAGGRLEPIYLRETQFVKAPPPRVIPS